MKMTVFFICCIAFLFSCSEPKTTKQPVFIDETQIEDTLIKANKFLLERDKELIQSFIKRI
jgi:hypothetical protein